MAVNDRPGPGSTGGTGSTLIVVVRPGVVEAQVYEVARELGVEIEPLYRPRPRRRAPQVARRRVEGGQPDPSWFYRVRAPQERLAGLVERLRQVDIFEGAYLKGPAELPVMGSDCPVVGAQPPPVTPKFETRQGYLNKAPKGVGAKFAWKASGGTGIDVQIIDVERAWHFLHEDLMSSIGGLVAGYPPADVHMEKHGTAVLGILAADRNAFGVCGVAPDANVRAVSTFDAAGVEDTASAIMKAAAFLGAGDIMLLEMHRLGPPDYGTGTRYIPVEWWPDDFAAILWATGQGILVFEAAGNGFSNLDDPLYDSAAPGFPGYWQNPFNRAIADSGAILVGAGAPPVGSWGRDRSRLDFSNFGSMLDAQGWGREVVTTGYGCLQGGSDMSRWYTAEFGGTSGALPMVAGAIACVQGRLAALGKALLSPATARSLLRSTGSPQQSATSGAPVTERIGHRPDLRAMFRSLSLDSRPRKRRKR